MLLYLLEITQFVSGCFIPLPQITDFKSSCNFFPLISLPFLFSSISITITLILSLLNFSYLPPDCLLLFILLTVINNAAMNVCVWVSFSVDMFSFLLSIYTHTYTYLFEEPPDFSKVTILHSHQQYVKVSVSPHHCSPLFSDFFFNSSHTNGHGLIVCFLFCFVFVLSFCHFLGLLPLHMEVPRLRVELEQ